MTFGMRTAYHTLGKGGGGGREDAVHSVPSRTAYQTLGEWGGSMGGQKSDVHRQRSDSDLQPSFASICSLTKSTRSSTRRIAHSSTLLTLSVTHAPLTHCYTQPPNTNACICSRRQSSIPTQPGGRAFDQLVISSAHVSLFPHLLHPWRLTHLSCACQGKLLLLCTAQPKCDSSTTLMSVASTKMLHP